MKKGDRKKNKRRKSKGFSPRPEAFDEVRALLGDMPLRRDLLIEYLHLIQDRYRRLSADHIAALAGILQLAQTEVYEVASFYHHFDLVGPGDADPPELTIRVCDSVSCEMAGGEALVAALEAACDASVRVQRVPCVGRCDVAPVAVVGQNPVAHADCDKVMQAARNKETRAAKPADAVLYDAYVKDGGYKTFHAVRDGKIKHDEVIAAVEASGLRGLGGAGFPTARKWQIVRDQEAPRYMALNLDEGEPGTFKDRHYLERDPHRFFEGMLIAACVVGCDALYIYLRDEYAGIRALLEDELARLQQGEAPGTLPHIELRRGAGAYICGEESAMIESIEGKRGMPRLRPPFVAQVGLFGRPTLEHNMETLFWVRNILEDKPEFFTKHKRNGRTGLRSYSVSGRVAKPGVHLAPAGVTIRELIDEYCGGMSPGHEFYAYFPGGASGGILPASVDNVPLDFDTLQEHGCFIGSAAIIVLSDKDRARDAATNAMRFFSHESCGKCTPCRVGTSKAVHLMAQDKWDIELMGELSRAMTDASICGLGQAASNPLQCTIKYFPNELK